MKCIYCGKNGKNEHSCRTKRKVGHLPNLIERIVALLAARNSILNIETISVAEFGMYIDHTTIRRLCKHNNICTPTISETKRSAITKQLYADTLVSKYGTGITNISQIPEVKAKKIKTNISRYGVTNPFQRSEIKENIKHVLFEKYGVYHPIHLENRMFHTGRLSKPHQLVSEYLTTIGVVHLNDKPGLFRAFNIVLNRIYCPIPDIYIPSKNVVIEIHGDYWHMNPARFGPTDTVRGFTGIRTASETWENDKNRALHIESFGVTILTVWESEIKHNFDLIKQRINTACNL